MILIAHIHLRLTLTLALIFGHPLHLRASRIFGHYCCLLSATVSCCRENYYRFIFRLTILKILRPFRCFSLSKSPGSYVTNIGLTNLCFLDPIICGSSEECIIGTGTTGSSANPDGVILEQSTLFQRFSCKDWIVQKCNCQGMSLSDHRGNREIRSQVTPVYLFSRARCEL
jgi:hypothetical protein